MVAFKKQFVTYSDNIVRTKEQNKRVTIPGQSLPMSLIVQRYQTGQLFGLSSFLTVHDYDDEPDYDHEVPFFPDPADPLALERASMLSKDLNNEFKRRKDEKEKDRTGGDNPPPASS